MGEGRAYSVRQAVYFQADVGDGSDDYNLIGRVKEVASLEEIGAEYYMESVLIGDSAYQVVQGFTGELVSARQEDGDRSAQDLSAAFASQTGDEEEANDRELLARFLIENL